MKNLVQKMLILAAVLSVSASAVAYDFEVGGIFYNILPNIYGKNQVEVTYEKGSTYDNINPSYTTETVVIPGKVEYNGTQFDVTAIGANAFLYCEQVVSIQLPNSITIINISAFSGCSNLASIDIPPSVATIKYMAFSDCKNLKEVRITDLSAWCKINYDIQDFGLDSDIYTPLSNGADLLLNGEVVADLTIPEDIAEIKPYAFAGCNSLVRVRINGNTAISRGAFRNCTNLEEITVPDDWANLAEYAIYGTAWLETQNDGPVYLGRALCGFNGEMPENYDFIIKDGTKSIPPSFFNQYGDCSYGWDRLRSVSIPASMENIGEMAFGHCINLEECYVDPGNERYCSIDGVLFDKAEKQIIRYPAKKANVIYQIPEWVTDIAPMAFYLTNNLISVSMTDNVTSIGKLAFAGFGTEDYKELCSKLSSIRLSSKLREIGDGAFWSLFNLQYIYSYNPEPPIPVHSEVFPFADVSDVILYVPEGSLEAYLAAPAWKGFKNIIEMPSASAKLVDASEINVVAQNGCIVANGFDGDEVIEVYSVSGQLVYKGTETTINVPTKGIYIVRVAGQTFKVIL